MVPYSGVGGDGCSGGGCNDGGGCDGDGSWYDCVMWWHGIRLLFEYVTWPMVHAPPIALIKPKYCVDFSLGNNVYHYCFSSKLLN